MKEVQDAKKVIDQMMDYINSQFDMNSVESYIDYNHFEPTINIFNRLDIKLDRETLYRCDFNELRDKVYNATYAKIINSKAIKKITDGKDAEIKSLAEEIVRLREFETYFNKQKEMLGGK